MEISFCTDIIFECVEIDEWKEKNQYVHAEFRMGNLEQIPNVPYVLSVQQRTRTSLLLYVSGGNVKSFNIC